MALLAKQGRASKEAAPDLPAEGRYIWHIWLELHSGRGGAMTPNPISWGDLDAYCRLVGEPLLPWEVRAIRAIDDAYIASTGE